MFQWQSLLSLMELCKHLVALSNVTLKNYNKCLPEVTHV